MLLIELIDGNGWPASIILQSAGTSAVTDQNRPAGTFDGRCNRYVLSPTR